MGQYWISFNLDKRRIRATRAKKLGEILPCGVFNYLSRFLVQPTGMRVRRFSPVRFSRHHRVHDVQKALFDDVSGDMEDDETEHVENVYLRLRIRKPGLPGPADFCPPPPQWQPNAQGKLQDIPPELMVMIFQHLHDDALALVCLSLACQSFFVIGFDSLLERHKEHYYAIRWIGDRIMCVGDYANANDLPKDVFTPAEVELVNPDGSEPEADDAVEDNNTDNQAQLQLQLQQALAHAPFAIGVDDPLFAEFMQAWQSEPTGKMDLQPALEKLCMEQRSHESQKNAYFQPFGKGFWDRAAELDFLERLSLTEKKRLLDLVHIDDTHVHQVDMTLPGWVLCNLTTGEYVRADAFDTIYSNTIPDKDEGEEEDIDPKVRTTLRALGNSIMSFGAVVGARFCWSSVDDTATVTRDLHRGPWAGHRFEITTLDRLRILEEDKQWKDISDGALTQLKTIWKNEWGRDWRRFI
ncbi:hypothetical protein EIP91_010167 [Steccherinum ochraceum]|uniref:F-box domain-containing protein n=1 Tax=Steccherinum ochraceum TaxID=92696 RepID=A0A4R0RRM5_9APHY|nr:hypothetical protein EIP91_010167 [Steccherinum ochraceum]